MDDYNTQSDQIEFSFANVKMRFMGLRAIVAAVVIVLVLGLAWIASRPSQSNFNHGGDATMTQAH
jgi:hypothetical protein